jgi:hypothetical protein
MFLSHWHWYRLDRGPIPWSWMGSFVGKTHGAQAPAPRWPWNRVQGQSSRTVTSILIHQVIQRTTFKSAINAKTAITTTIHNRLIINNCGRYIFESGPGPVSTQACGGKTILFATVTRLPTTSTYPPPIGVTSPLPTAPVEKSYKKNSILFKLIKSHSCWCKFTRRCWLVLYQHYNIK